MLDRRLSHEAGDVFPGHTSGKRQPHSNQYTPGYVCGELRQVECNAAQDGGIGLEAKKLGTATRLANPILACELPIGECCYGFRSMNC
jgi:hypothetical protein